MTRIIETDKFIGKRIALLLWHGSDDAAYAVGTIVDAAGHILSLAVGNLPDSIHPSELTQTGLRWPDEDE